MAAFERSVNKRQEREKKKRQLSAVRAEILMNMMMDKEVQDQSRKERLLKESTKRRKEIKDQLKKWENERRSMENRHVTQAHLDK